MDNQQLTGIVSALGGLDNIVSATNCMTRLRVTVASEGLVDEAAIKKQPEVLGLVHDQHAYYEIVVGPGKAKTCATALKEMLKSAGASRGGSAAGAAQSNDDSSEGAASSGQKATLRTRFKRFCKVLGAFSSP